MRVKVPTDWEDISVKQFQDYKEAIVNVEGLAEQMLVTCSCFTNKGIVELQEISVKELSNLFLQVTELTEKPVNIKLKEVITLNGIKYRFDKQFDQMSAKQWMHVETVIAGQDPIQVIHYILASLYRPDQNGKPEKYDNHIENADLFLETNMDIANAVSFFFSNFAAEKLKTSLKYIQRDLKRIENRLILKQMWQRSTAGLRRLIFWRKEDQTYTKKLEA